MLNFLVKTSLIFIVITSGLLAKTSSVFQHFTIESGLPNNEVYGVMQDDFGFIWFATLSGLSRYDGYKFKNYTTSTRNQKSPGVSTWRLTKADGGFWISLWGEGLSFYDYKSESFTNYFHEQGNSNSISNNNVFKVIVDRHQRVWIATYGGGIDLLDMKTGNFTHLRHDPNTPKSLSSDHPISLLKGSNGYIWVGHRNGGFDRIDPGTNTVKRFPALPKSKVLQSLYEDENGVIWIGTSEGLFLFDKKTGILSDLYTTWLPDLSKSAIMDMKPKKDGGFWLVTNFSGVFNCNPKREQAQLVYKESYMNKQLVKFGTNSILESTHGDIWLTTANGVFHYSAKYNRFKNLSEIKNVKFSVNDIAVAENGSIFLATNSLGVILFNKKEGTFQYPKGLEPLTNSFPQCFDIDKKGDLWIATHNGLYVYNCSRDEIIGHYKKGSDNGLSSNKLKSIMVHPNGTVWYTTKDNSLGIKLFVPNEGVVKNYRHSSDNSDSIAGDWVERAFIDREENIWLATDSGATHINAKTGKIKNYIHQPGDEKSISAGEILTIFQDSSNKMWFGSSNGFCLLNKEDSTFQRFHPKKKDGLQVVSVIEDNHGFFWLGTNNGIVRFDPKKESFWFFDETDGVSGKAFNPSAVAKTESGEVYFGSQTGLNCYSGKELQLLNECPPVHITNLSIFNQTLIPSESTFLPQSILLTDEVILEHSQNVFKIDFIALDYKAPNKIDYYYKLKGFDADWIKTSASERYTTYMNLDSGTYKFMVKSTNSDKVIGCNIDELAVTILPPWWKTWWFKVVTILVSIFLLLTLHSIKTRRYKIRATILEESVKEKTKDLLKMYQKAESEKIRAEVALRSEREAIKQNLNFIDMISHEYRTPLSIINSCLKIIDHKFSAKMSTDFTVQINGIRDASNRLLNLFESTLRKNMTHNSKTVLNKEELDIIEIIKTAMTLVQRVYPNHKISLTPPSQDQCIISADKELLITVFSNILDNACKYSTTNSKVNIEIDINSSVSIKIKDEGIGLKPEELNTIFEKFYRSKNAGKTRGAGMGLFMVKKIVDMHKGYVSASSNGGNGTTFTVRFKKTTEEINSEKL